MTAEEFVAKLDADNQVLLRGLDPDATLKPEIQGPLNVPNLLKVALPATRSRPPRSPRDGWSPATTYEVKLALARQVGDEAKHYRLMPPSVCVQLGIDTTHDRSAGREAGARSFLLSRHAVDHRRARGGRPVHPRGHRGGEEPAVHRVLRACGRSRDRGALPGHDRARRAVSPRAGPAAAAPLRRLRPTPRRWRPRRPAARSRWRRNCSRRRWPRSEFTTRRAAEGRGPHAARVRGALAGLGRGRSI